MSFESYILDQKNRDDGYGAISRSFQKDLEKQNNHNGENKLSSNTLFGLFNHASFQGRQGNNNNISLINLWNEYARNKKYETHTDAVDKGYIYFFKHIAENAFKLGKSKKDPIFLKSELETNLKRKVYLYNWMNINNYSLIESELKQVFSKYLRKDDWYQFEHYRLLGKGKVICLEIQDAISLYSQTDNECVLFKEIYTDKLKSI